MENKIFEKVKEKEIESSNELMRALGILEEGDYVVNTYPKKNNDLMIILSKLGLITPSEEVSDTINDFYEYLFKFGIECGIGTGKNMIIDAVKNNSIDIEDLMEMDPENYVESIFAVPSIGDMIGGLQ